jgi:hypothetical protein
MKLASVEPLEFDTVDMGRGNGPGLALQGGSVSPTPYPDGKFGTLTLEDSNPPFQSPLLTACVHRPLR